MFTQRSTNNQRRCQHARKNWEEIKGYWEFGLAVVLGIGNLVFGVWLISLLFVVCGLVDGKVIFHYDTQNRIAHGLNRGLSC